MAAAVPDRTKVSVIPNLVLDPFLTTILNDNIGNISDPGHYGDILKFSLFKEIYTRHHRHYVSKTQTNKCTLEFFVFTQIINFWWFGHYGMVIFLKFHFLRKYIPGHYVSTNLEFFVFTNFFCGDLNDEKVSDVCFQKHVLIILLLEWPPSALIVIMIFLHLFPLEILCTSKDLGRSHRLVQQQQQVRQRQGGSNGIIVCVSRRASCASRSRTWSTCSSCWLHCQSTTECCSSSTGRCRKFLSGRSLT